MQEDDQVSRRGAEACKEAHTVLVSELVDGVDEAVVQIGRPSQARHLGPVVLPHAPAPLPADHRRPHHGHLPAVSAPSYNHSFKSSAIAAAIARYSLLRQGAAI
jgi:hypothetical protein